MPGPAFIDELKGEHARLSRLIAHIDGGRWWTAEEPGRAQITELTVQVDRIRGALDEIEQTVGALGNA